MDTDVLQLASALYHGKGAYALLAGSGVSRGAGVPTGWEIMRALIREIAAANKTTIIGKPEDWYQDKYGKPARYDEILEMLAPAQAEQPNILRPFFEPTEDERRDGIKIPSLAHRRIAELARDGYLKIILTTNFDRLLETALRDLGIEPIVLSSENAITDAIPIFHAPAPVIIKLHGDYLDTPLKNSPESLKKYADVVEKLLRLIFENYGLIVCGWSSTWDIALKNALDTVNCRYYSAYWTAHSGNIESDARDLATRKSAKIIPINGADQFFAELFDNVKGIEESVVTTPLEVTVLVERVKRYIPRMEEQIRLAELMLNEINTAHNRLNNSSLKDQIQAMERAQQAIQTTQSKEAREDWEKSLHELMAAFFQIIDGPLRALTTLSLYGNRTHVEHILAALQLWAQLSDNELSLQPVWKLIPSLILLYSCGIASVHKKKWEILENILTTPKVSAFGQRVAVYENVNDRFLSLFFIPGRALLGKEIDALLYPIFQFYIPSNGEYSVKRDTFEMIMCLASLKENKTRPMPAIWTWSSQSDSRLKEFCDCELGLMQKSTNFFLGDPSELRTNLAKYQDRINDGRKPYYFGSMPDLATSFEQFIGYDPEGGIH